MITFAYKYTILKSIPASIDGIFGITELGKDPEDKRVSISIFLTGLLNYLIVMFLFTRF